MALTPGTRFGVYDITSLIGEGGMGRVYRATDTTLGRQVAIKILPDAFASDPERLARFEREAKTLASLNHPHIAAIYGFEKSAGLHALVMELVDGEDLSQRIAHGAMSLDEALPIATQIAEALEAAHEQGIIHRDLKPANIKLRPDGTVKVLDFGLAKAIEPATSTSAVMTSAPTITSPAMMTGVGMILGTAAYMSPEQARGRPADKRCDVWAFGCVLYEMFTGKRAFEAHEISDTLAAVLRADPDWSALPSSTPANVRALLTRCLEKDARRRIASISTAQFLLTNPLNESAGAPAAGRWGERAIWSAGLFALLAALAFVLIRTPPPSAPLPLIRFPIETPPGEYLPGANGVPRFAVSQDGQFITFDSTLPGRHDQLWIRRLDSAVAQPLRSTETPAVSGIGAQQPFWSPDNRYIGFFDEASATLKRVDVQKGVVQKVSDAPGNQYGGTWSAAGVILFSSTATNGLQSVSSDGGTPVQVTTVDRKNNETQHLWPVFLPDGRHFLYYAAAAGTARPGIVLGSLDSPARTRLIDADSGPQFAAPDVLLYVQGRALMAQRLDVNRRMLSGDPAVVVDSVLRTNAGRLAASVSNGAVLVYASTAGEPGRRLLTWFDRAGKTQVPIGPPIAGSSVSLAADGRRVAVADGASGSVAVADGASGSVDVWIYDPDRDVMSRLTTDPAPDANPVWSPDGSRIVFRTARNRVEALYETQASGSLPERELFKGEGTERIIPWDWSPDGRLIVFGRGPDLWVLPAEGDRKPSAYLTTPFAKVQAVLSPNGRWLAYASNEPGTLQVFVQSFPNASGGKWQVSTAGGYAPRWSRNGRELFYLDPSGRMMGVPVTTDPLFRPGQPAALFNVPLVEAPLERGTPYDVGPDGRFLVSVPRAVENSPPLQVVVNWASRILNDKAGK